MRVFEYHQNRPAARQGFELMQQRLEQHLALALRAEVEVGSAELGNDSSSARSSISSSPRAPGASNSRSLPSFSSTVSSRAKPAARSSWAMNG